MDDFDACWALGEAVRVDTCDASGDHLVVGVGDLDAVADSVGAGRGDRPFQ